MHDQLDKTYLPTKMPDSTQYVIDLIRRVS